MPTLEEILNDPIVKAFNPKGKQFMEARWISGSLSRVSTAGASVAALIPFKAFPHIKAPATFQMMLEDSIAGRHVGMHTIVVPSSGNTAHAVARIAKAFGFKNVKVVLSVDVPESKKGILAALSSVYIIEVPKGRSTAKEAEEIARASGHYLLDQYGHEGNVHAHEYYTGPEIERVMGGDVDIMFIGLGSSGTATGVARYLKSNRPNRQVFGVRPLRGERVPGVRDGLQMDEVVTIPYREILDGIIEVSRKESFIWMRRLWDEVEPQPGPSSGMAFAGYLEWRKQLEGNRIKFLAGKKIGFICPDDGRFYSERTTGELDPDQGLSS
jgi:cysteine synthase